MANNQSFQPILLGSDINVYGMARSFHEEYGITSIAFSAGGFAQTKYSKIVQVRVFPNFDQEEIFLATLRQFAEEHKEDSKQYLLMPCGDGYASLLSKHKDELAKFFEVATIDFSLYEQLEDKADFYKMCEKHGLPYPNTVIVEPYDDLEKVVEGLPYPYPMVLKPSNSISWLHLEIEGKKKAFIVESEQEMSTILKRIYDADYQDEMIIQDFIPGSDANMRVLNAYVDKNHQVRMMCLGHPLLEDPSPQAIGNYMIILPDYNEKIYRQVQEFLEGIEYTGFANFDMKYDYRDGEYKLFEINLRQGRSSFYVTLNGYNLAKYYVEDRVKNLPYTETVFGKGDMMWLGVPKSIALKYVDDNVKETVEKYFAKGKTGTTVFYRGDFSFKRYALQRYVFWKYKEYFRTYWRDI